MDLETMTNNVLRNDYDLHEKSNKKQIKQQGEKNPNNNSNNKKEKNKRKNKSKKKKTLKQKIFKFLKVIIIIVVLLTAFIFVFFKTEIFQKYKELWVQTAMTTMKHQYLATWFLSPEEIEEIMKKLEVKNNENSNSKNIEIKENKNNEIKIEKIKEKGYVGYVMIIPDATKVKLIDTRKSNRGSKLSEAVKENNAKAGTNAGGFADSGGVGSGNVLCDVVIIDKKLENGNKNTRYSLIGMDSKGILILGKYTYQEAMNAGIVSAVEFGPYLIVNGNKQISNANSGGIQPRMAVGQKKDGTFIFVVIDGRQVGYSVGATLLDLQKIFEKYGAYNAANLDGGSSATMYNNGKVVNKTSTPMGERYIPNAFIVKK